MRAAIAVALVAAVGCAKAQADRVEKSETTMEDRGARPQFLLRYEIPEGTSQTVDVIVDIEVEMSGAASERVVMPRMIATEEFEVTKVDTQGGMHLTTVTSGVAFERRPETQARVMEAVEGTSDSLERMRMTATLLPNGLTKGLRVDMTSVSSKEGRDMAKQIEQALDTMVAVLPEVSVGVGARWKVEQTVRLQGMKVFYVFRYEVLEISADRAVIHADMEMTAPPQPIVTPQGTVRLEALVGEGSVDMALDLHKIVDRVDLELKVGMTMSGGGQRMDIDVGTVMQVLPTGEEPKPARVERNDAHPDDFYPGQPDF